MPELVPEQGQHIDKGRFSFEKHARHNEISVLLYSLLNDTGYKKINRQNKALIEHVIFWHHAKPLRKQEFETLDSIFKGLVQPGSSETLDLLIQSVNHFILAVNQISHDYGTDNDLCVEGLSSELDEDSLYDLPTKPVPAYKLYHSSSDQLPDFARSINENAKRNLARTAVVTADRLVSALSSEQLTYLSSQRSLHSIIEPLSRTDVGLISCIERCLQGFETRFPGSERNQAQTAAALRLKDISGIAVLNGPAGCGKTKIALEWATRTHAEKIIWVCPRVQICQGLMLDLTGTNYLPDARIEIYTGEFQYIQHNGQRTDISEGQAFSGDIVLTTVDQVLNLITTHRNVTGLIEFLQAHVVFDEFHEYIPIPGFNLLFAELVRCKQLCQPNANTLLVSATPNLRFVDAILEIPAENVVSIPSFNHSHYQIDFMPFDEQARGLDNPLYASQPANSIVISNTATTAQLSFIENQQRENGILLHSKFTPSHKQCLFESVFASFGPTGGHQFDVLRSGPIVQASLNITSSRMITEFTHAENWLQRMGRLGRFGECRGPIQYITAVPNTIVAGNFSGACARFLSAMDCLNSAVAWYQFLRQQDLSDPITIQQLYQWYEEFYLSEAGLRAVDADLIRSLQRGVNVIQSRLLDPVCLPQKSVDDGKQRLKRISLRGNSRYVQLATLQIQASDNWRMLNHYISEEGDSSDMLTLSIDEIEGYDAMGDNNLMRYMHQKHHKIMTAKTGVKHKKAYKLFILEKEAIDPDHPIYLSYTQADLELCHDTPHSHAIYYAISDKQPIGALSLNKLTSIR